MADIKQIKVNGTVYDIKDNNAITEADFTYQSADLSTGMTGYLRYIVIGELVVFTGAIINATDAALNTVFATGLPAYIATGAANFPVIGQNNNIAAGQWRHFYIQNNGYFKAGEAIPAGNWRFSGAYLR